MGRVIRWGPPLLQPSDTDLRMSQTDNRKEERLGLYLGIDTYLNGDTGDSEGSFSLNSLVPWEFFLYK